MTILSWQSIFQLSCVVAIGLLTFTDHCLGENPRGETIKYGKAEMWKTPAKGRVLFGDSGFSLMAPPDSFCLECVDSSSANPIYLYPWLGTSFGRYRLHSYPSQTTPNSALQKSIEALDLRKRTPNNTAYSYLRSEKLTTKSGLHMVVGYFGYNHCDGNNIGKISFYFRDKKGTTFCLCCEPWSKHSVNASKVVELVVDTLREE